MLLMRACSDCSDLRVDAIKQRVVHRRQRRSPKIPVPRGTSYGRARVFERFVLESMRRNAKRCAIGQQSRSIRTDQMHHLASLPDMTVEPQSTVHRVYHPIVPPQKLARARYAIEFAQSRQTSRSDRIINNPGKALGSHGERRIR